MEDVLIRFPVGGLVVSFFSILADILRPKSFAELLGAALGRARDFGLDPAACRERICRI
jgi:hypothetical protein